MSDAEDKNSNSAPASTGIIHPPPDMRTLVDKTASLVAKWGPEYGKKIINNYAGNPNFSFLSGSDPYHAYYQHRILEFHSQNQNPADIPPPADCNGTDPPILDPAEAEQYKKWLPEGITGEELDRMKRYARLVARYGESYVHRLRTKPQSQLLKKPSHSMSMFLKTLEAAYWKVLMPPQLLPKKRKTSAGDMMRVLERELHHLECQRSQEKAVSHSPAQQEPTADFASRHPFGKVYRRRKNHDNPL